MLMLTVTCPAQRYNDARNLSVSGLVLKNGYGFTAGYEKLSGNGFSYVVDMEYMGRKEKLKIKDDKAKLADFNLTGGVRKYFSSGHNNVLPYIGIRGILGYENIINRNKLPETVVISRKTEIQLGAGAELGVEYNLKLISFYGAYYPRYEFRNAEYINSVQLGIKYFLK
jgi:hypothetical protein